MGLAATIRALWTNHWSGMPTTSPAGATTTVAATTTAAGIAHTDKSSSVSLMSPNVRPPDPAREYAKSVLLLWNVARGEPLINQVELVNAVGWTVKVLETGKNVKLGQHVRQLDVTKYDIGGNIKVAVEVLGILALKELLTPELRENLNTVQDEKSDEVHKEADKNLLQAVPSGDLDPTADRLPLMPFTKHHLEALIGFTRKLLST